MMTAQEVFDKVANHLRKQGRQSISADGECVYRSKNGLKCAVGCLIPDENYNRYMEGRTVRELVKDSSDCPRDCLDLFTTHLDLLEDLQQVHDEGWASLEARLEMVASKHKLIYTPPIQ